MSTIAVEVVYRGIFQKTLARNIVRSIVFAARKEGKIGTAFGRYGDSPERNGIPAKQFAIVADTAEELEENLAVYEAHDVDVTINVDDTMSKGIESWAWYGLQPINQLTKPNGTLIVTSRQEAEDLIEDMNNSTFTTQGGVKIEKGVTPLNAEHALNKIYQYIDTKKVRFLSVIMKFLTDILAGIWVLCTLHLN